MDKSNEYCFFIGHNNKTRKREIAKAKRILNANGVKGYSLNKEVVGVWLGQEEASFCFTVISNEFNPFSDTRATALRFILEKELKQDLVLTTKKEVIIL